MKKYLLLLALAVAGFASAEAQTFSAITADQPLTYPAPAGQQNSQIMRINVTAVAGAAMSATSFSFALPAGVNAADITNAKLFWSGVNTAWASTQPLLGTAPNPGNTFTITFATAQALAVGPNYFWLTYDLSTPIPVGHVLDVTCTAAMIGGVERVGATPINPVGQRVIKTPLAGVVTVGTGGTYTSLVTACGELDYLGSSAPVTFQITSNLTETDMAEILNTGNVTLNPLTIKPAPGVSPTISSAHALPCIYVAAYNNVTIDGSNTVNGKTRDLSFVNTGTSGNSHGVYVENSSVTGFTLKNVKIQGGPAGAGIFVQGVANSTIDNCEVNKGGSAIAVQGSCSNVAVTNNLFGSMDPALAFSTTPVYFTSLAATNTMTGINFSKNTIQGLNGPTASSGYSGAYFKGVDNSTISGNVIKNIKTTATSSEVYALRIEGWNGTAPFQTLNTVYSNNVITDVSSPNQTFAVLVLNYNNATLYNNVIDVLPTATGGATVGTFFENCTNVKFKNNILQNKTTATGSNFLLYCSGTATDVTFTELDNNIYNLAASGTTYLGVYDGNGYPTFAIWQTAIAGKELASFAKVPYFTSDYHINGLSVGDRDFIAPLIPAVTTDIDGETRLAEANYVGIDQALPVLTFTQNPVASLYNCNATTTIFNVAAQLTNFSDNIARTGYPTILTYAWKKDGLDVPMTPNYVIAGPQLSLVNANNTMVGAYSAIATYGLTKYSSTVCNFDVYYPIAITAQPSPTTGACWGNAPSVTLSVTATGNIDHYQWQKTTDGGTTWQNYVNPTSTAKDLVIPFTSSPDAVKGLYRVIVFAPTTTPLCGNQQLISDASEVVITVPLSLAKVTPSILSSSVCEGTTMTLSASAQGTITGYRWQRQKNGNWMDIAIGENATANSKDFVLAGLKPDESATFRVLVLGSSQCTINQLASSEYVLSVLPKFFIKSHPQSATICEGSFIKLSVIGSSEITAYQWFVDGQKIDVSTNASAKESYFFVEHSKYDQSGAYHCELTVTDCQGTKTVASDVAEVFVLKPTEITKEPTMQNMAPIGGKVTFVVEAQNKGKIPPFYKDKYQWFRYNAASKKIDSVFNSDKFAGVNSSILTIVNVSTTEYTKVGDYYFATVVGLCGADTSKNVYLTAPPSVTISTDPLPVENCEGKDIDFTVDAVCSDPAYTLNYQWYKDGAALANSARIIGADKSQLTIKAALPTDKGNYKAVVTINGTPYSKTSAEGSATITIEAGIVTQPVPTLAIQTGKDAEISVVAKGDLVMYQWMKDGVDLTFSTDATLKLTNAQTTNSGKYWVKVSNACKEVYSDTCVVTVAKEKVTGVTGEDNEIVFGIAPNPMNESAELTYSSNEGDAVRISINDITGKEIATLFEGLGSKGSNKLDINANKFNLNSGVYVIKFVKNSNVYTAKFMVNR